MGNFWDGARAVLDTVAPALASAVGGPLAGTATNAILSAIGLGPDASADQAADALKAATPDQLLALRKADQDFDATMAKLSNDDRASARSREIAVKDRTPELLALGLTAGFFGLLGVMLFHVLPSGSENVLQVMLGALGSSFGMMVSYYYGASAAANKAPNK